MGNTNKLVELEKTIIIDPGVTLLLNQLATFPHGYDGLHIWQAGIILARFILYEKHLFKGKDILELGTGVGIGGLTALKYAQCRSCTLTDYNEKILQNLHINCKRNNVEKAKVQKLDWTQHQSYDRQFDIIIGSDIVYFGCPVADLYQLIKKCLRKRGQAYIIIPNRKNYAELFTKQVQNSVFSLQKVLLKDERYRQSPLQDKEQGLKEYNLLKDIDFYVYRLTKL